MSPAYYVVFKGDPPGVYASWEECARATQGISNAVYKRCKTWQDGVDRWIVAHERGWLETVERAPAAWDPQNPVPRRNPIPLPAVADAAPSGLGPAGKNEMKTKLSASAAAGPVSRTRSGGESTEDGLAKRLADIEAGVAMGRADRERRRLKASASVDERRMGPARDRQQERKNPKSKSRDGPQPLAKAATAPPQVFASASTASGARVIPVERPSSPIRSRSKGKAKASSTVLSSSPPTGVTQTRNIFSSDESTADALDSSPRYAQTLTYYSPSINSEYSMRSPSIASSDCRSHLSSPVSDSTQYFPEDFLARQQQRERQRLAAEEAKRQLSDESREVEDRELSEYDTAPNTPMLKDGAFPGRVLAAGRAGGDGNSGASRKSRERTFSRSSPATGPSSSSSPTKRKRPVARTQSDAAIQTEPVPKRKPVSTGAQTDVVPERHFVDGGNQTSPSVPVFAVPSPGVPSSVSSSSSSSRRPRPQAQAAVPRVPSPRTVPLDTPCVCPIPQWICLQCSRPPAAAPPQPVLPATSSSPTSASGARRSRTTPTHRAARSPRTTSPTGTTSPSLDAVTSSTSFARALAGSSASSSSASWHSPPPASSISARSSATPPASPSPSPTPSAKTSVGGASPHPHTPLLGASDRAAPPSAHLRARAALGALTFAQPPRGWALGPDPDQEDAMEGVVHDGGFDPRSPLQRGTGVPARSGVWHARERPSPALSPLPMPSAFESMLFSQ
ncbi:uncharacterized protein BXZ73DRAFT_97912 [Epithele typhae]|uniref:uncharacterized protein n=1 Tax=Epithele typhae TaxID=378194 RepID=UPI0020073635|nr:uncharacterized protein BXZ73DRAFT_97912 [Epithele typhae]KAH9942501.1 hypothetical protein BXZ73DRAFT_97912 [Epithele typhae]